MSAFKMVFGTHLCKNRGDLIEGVENPTVARLSTLPIRCSYLPGLRSLSRINGASRWNSRDRPRSETIIVVLGQEINPPRRGFLSPTCQRPPFHASHAATVDVNSSHVPKFTRQCKFTRHSGGLSDGEPRHVTTSTGGRTDDVEEKKKEVSEDSPRDRAPATSR